jgi:hypothetical protein
MTPIGAVVRIYYDGRRLEKGDVLQTLTGRMYLVVHVRLQAKGKHAGRRQHLACVVVSEAPPETRVLPIRWYSRARRRRR